MGLLKFILPTVFLSIVFSAQAFAGAVISIPVHIKQPYFFEGSIGDARSNSDPRMGIGCLDYGDSATCGATTTPDGSLNCVTSDPSHLAVIRSMDDSSYLRVQVADGICINITVQTSSALSPKGQ